MARVDIVVAAKDQASKAIQGMGSKIKGSVNNLIKLPHILAAGAIGFAIKSIIGAYGKQEEAIAKLNAALRASGNFTQQVSDALTEQAAALQKTTTFGDEQIISAQAMLASFKLTEEQIKKIIPVTLDMAAATGVDAARAAVLMGKAAVGVTGELSRYGIIVDKTDLKNRGLSAVLDEVRLNFGGTAEAIAKTGVGPMKQFSNLVGDLKEKLGEALLPALTSIVNFIKDNLPEIEALLTNTLKIVGALVESVVKIVKFTKELVSVQREAAAVTASEAENLEKLKAIIESNSENRNRAIKIMKRFSVLNAEIIKAENGEIASSKEQIELWKIRREAIAAEVVLLREKEQAIKDTSDIVVEKDKEQLELEKEIQEEIKEMTMEATAFELDQIEQRRIEIIEKLGDEVLANEWASGKILKIRAEASKKESKQREEDVKKAQEATLAKVKLQEEAQQAEIEGWKGVFEGLSSLESASKEQRKPFAIANVLMSQGEAISKTWGQIGGAPWMIPVAVAQTAIIISNMASQISKIQALAEGGIVTQPTLAMIGEKGPEAVIPLDQVGTTLGQQPIQVTQNFQILDLEGISEARKREWAEALKPFFTNEEEGRG